MHKNTRTKVYTQKLTRSYLRWRVCCLLLACLPACLETNSQSADFAFPSWFVARLKVLLGKILVADPKQRITLSQVADTEWFLEVRVLESCEWFLERFVCVLER